MEAYLPMIQSILLDWYQVTLDNKEYAGALAIVVWLLTAMFYSIRIFFLKKTNAINLKARLALQDNLDNAQQQLQAAQEQLAANTEQLIQAQAALAESSDRVADLIGKIAQDNQRLIDGIKALAGNFELTAPSLPNAETADAADLWQRYADLSGQAVERFKAEQQGKTELQLALWAETSKLAEKEAVLGPLQLRLEAQTEQLNKLELAVEEQKILREREQAAAEKRLAETIDRHQAELARYADATQRPTQAPAASPAQPVSAPEPKVTVVEKPIVSQVSVEPVVAPAPVPVAVFEEPPKAVKAEAPPVQEKAEVAEPALAPKQSSVDKLAEKSGGFGRFKQMLNNTMQQMAKLDQKLGTQTTVVAEAIEEEIEQLAAPVAEVVDEIKESAAEMAESMAEAVKEPAAGIGGKLKNLFGKAKAEEAVREQVPAITEPTPGTAPAEADRAEAAGLKGLFKNWK